MKNYIILIFTTICLFVISMDFLFYTNIVIDLLIVIVYLLLIARSTLRLDMDIIKIEEEFILREKKSALFSPLIFLFFLSTSISFGIIPIIINILVIGLLYGYVFVSLKRNKIIVNDNIIKVEYLNGKSSSMKWRDITQVDFDWVYNLIILRDKNNIQLKLDISLKGFLVLITMIKERLLKSDYENAFKKLTNYYKCFLINSNNI